MMVLVVSGRFGNHLWEFWGDEAQVANLGASNLPGDFYVVPFWVVYTKNELHESPGIVLEQMCSPRRLGT